MAPRPASKDRPTGPNAAIRPDPPHPPPEPPEKGFARASRLSPLERAAAALATALQTPDSRRHFCRRVLVGFRVFLAGLSALYYLPLALLAVGIHWWAEKNLTLAFFSYLPSHLWLLPAPVLFLVTLPFSWRIALAQLLAAAAFVILFLDYQGAPETIPSPESAPRLTILSYNRGQHRNQSLQPFKNAMKPDLIALQESFGRAGLYGRAETYDEFDHADGVGEFVLLSKFPILNQRLLSFTAWDDEQEVAARFEVDFHGESIALYVVHMPTLRDVLAYYRRGAFLYGVLGVPGTPLNARRKKAQRYWDERVELARKLQKAIASDPLPCIAVGDFNMPDHGLIYHLFTQTLDDAHEKAGGGFGYTFPGVTNNPLTLEGPWLRLDFAFASEAWATTSFVTEKGRTSQHRAIAAGFFLK